MIIDKSLMLEQFCDTDEVYYYADCVDITYAGDDYKAKEYCIFCQR